MTVSDRKMHFQHDDIYIMDSKSYGIILVSFSVFLVACNSTEQNQFDDLPGPCIIRRTKLPRLEPVKVQNIFSFYNTDQYWSILIFPMLKLKIYIQMIYIWPSLTAPASV